MSASDASGFERALDDSVRQRVVGIHLFDVIDSTNSFLLRQPPPQPGAVSIALADDQTAGRGRHDRHWVSQKGASLCLSVAYTFAVSPDALLGLTPIMGVAVSRALRAMGVEGVQLKWPNDLVVTDCKLGGLLAETQLKAGHGVTVVAGVGINLDLPQELLEGSVSAWASQAIDLKSVAATVPSRDELAARVVGELCGAFDVFASGERTSLLGEWRTQDWLLGKKVVVDDSGAETPGTAAGIDDEGALLLDTAEGSRRVIAGSIRVIN